MGKELPEWKKNARDKFMVLYRNFICVKKKHGIIKEGYTMFFFLGKEKRGGYGGGNV